MKTRFFLLLIIILAIGIGMIANEIIHSEIPSSFLGEIISFLEEKEIIKVNKRVEIGREELLEYFFESKAFQDKISLDDYYVLLPDKIYYLPTNLTEFKKFLREDNLDKCPYLEEKFDCDDFPFVLKVRATENRFTLGIVSIEINPGETEEVAGLKETERKAHGLNLLLIWNNGEIQGYFVEPQDDTLIPVNEYSEGRVFHVWF